MYIVGDWSIPPIWTFRIRQENQESEIDLKQRPCNTGFSIDSVRCIRDFDSQIKPNKKKNVIYYSIITNYLPIKN